MLWGQSCLCAYRPLIEDFLRTDLFLGEKNPDADVLLSISLKYQYTQVTISVLLCRYIFVYFSLAHPLLLAARDFFCVFNFLLLLFFRNDGKPESIGAFFFKRKTAFIQHRLITD